MCGLIIVVQTGGMVSAYDPLAKKTPFYDPTFQSSTTECGGSTVLTGDGNAAQVWNYLIGKGLTPVQVAGIMGNMKAESHFEPRLVEYGYPNSKGEISQAGKPSSLDDNIPLSSNGKGQPGYGIVQWSGGRKNGLLNLATSRNSKGSDLGLQLDYVWQELNGPYKNSVLTPLQASTTVEDAIDVVLEKYEHPANIEGQRPGRRNNGREMIATYGSGTGTTTTPTEPATSSCAPVALDASGCPGGPVSSDVIVTAPGTSIRVHPCIANEVARIVDLAHKQGLDLSGWGWRDNADQIRLRAEHGCGGADVYNENCKPHPPTAVPGKSRHERGTAVDFTCKGSTIGSHSDPCFVFMRNNTSLKNLESEPWHWSIDGH